MSNQVGENKSVVTNKYKSCMPNVRFGLKYYKLG